MHKIGIISDTHGWLRPEVVENLQGCEAILHGGDVGKPEILEALNQLAPVYAVRGNTDGEWAGRLPEVLAIELFKVRFFLVHNKKMISGNTAGADIVIYGHSHRYEEKYAEGTLRLNPGSCGPARFTLPITMAALEIKEDGSFQVKKIEINSPSSKGALPKRICGGGDNMSLDMGKIIREVMRNTDRGMAVDEIAQRCGIDRKLAEQICRLYLTHPGVDTDGIMGKMGL